MNKKIAVTEQKLRWVTSPSSGHYVHFYQERDSLLEPLTNYIRTGLANGETCILIATERHVSEITKRLSKRGINVAVTEQSGDLIILDAATTLSKFMDGDIPDERLFYDVIGSLIGQVATTEKPIRAYGEMVALLWQNGNKAGVLKLEALWNELGQKHPFSLFCAYPELHFFMHGDVVQEISDCHDAHHPLQQAIQPA